MKRIVPSEPVSSSATEVSPLLIDCRLIPEAVMIPVTFKLAATLTSPAPAVTRLRSPVVDSIVLPEI